MLRYLNELYFYYLATGSEEMTEEWVRVLRQCTLPDTAKEKTDVQQIKTLSIVVKDLKLNRGHQVFTNVFVDGVCLAKTRELPCTGAENLAIFDERFHFDDLSPHAESFSCEVQLSKRSRIGSLVVRDPIHGRVHIHLSDLPNNQDDDKWHQLLQSGGGAKAATRGTIRLVANFKDRMILPLDEYRELRDLLCSEDLNTIEVLARVCKDHHAELASTLIHIYCFYDRVIPILTRCLEKSVQREENTATLFRASTLSTMLMDQFMKLTASSYLHSILKEPIRQIIAATDASESTGRNSDMKKLEVHLENVLKSVFSSAERCPPTLRFIFRILQEQVIQKWPTDPLVRTRAVSGFLFLRFICPALLKPHVFDLTQDPPSPAADRMLKLVTKSTQNLANLTEPKVKQNFMDDISKFVQRNRHDMIHFVNDISAYSVNPPHIDLNTDPRKDLAAIHHLCITYEEALETLKPKNPQDLNVKPLLRALTSLRLIEKKFTNRFSA